MDSRFYNLLGICRKAGKIGWGHDAALGAIIADKAKLCLLTNDASERLKNEFVRACTYEGRKTEIIVLDRSMEDMKKIIGVKAAVLSINDDGFANRLRQYNEHISEVDVYGN